MCPIIYEFIVLKVLLSLNPEKDIHRTIKKIKKDLSKENKSIAISATLYECSFLNTALKIFNTPYHSKKVNLKQMGTANLLQNIVELVKGKHQGLGLFNKI